MIAVHYDLRRNLAVYGSWLLLIILVIYNLIRTGLDLQLEETLKTGGFVLFLLNFPTILAARLRTSRKSALRDEYFWLFMLMLMSCILGGLNVQPGYLLTFFGVVCFGYNAWRYFSSFSKDEAISLAFLLFLGVWYGITIWDGDNLHPMLLERLAFDDRIHIDTIFHSSIAQMIKTYSVPTTGLNGLPFYHYHFGSHVVMAYISNLLDISVFTFYQIGFPSLFFPLFVKAILSLPVLWREKFGDQPVFRCSFSMWLLLSACLIGVFPLYRILAKAQLQISPLFASESYGFSFLLVLLIINFALFHYRFDSEQKSYHLTFIPAIVLLVMTFFLGLTKNSSLFMFDIFIAYLFFRLQLYKQGKAWVYYSLIGLISLVSAYLTFDHRAGDGAFSPFAFFEKHIQINPPLFIVVYFFWSLVLTGVCLVLQRKMKMDGQRPRLYLRVLVEATIVVSVIGAIPAILFDIAGGSAHFFMNFQMWLSCSFLLMILPAVQEGIMDLAERTKVFNRPHMVRVGILLIMSYFALMALYNFRKSAKIYVKHHLEDKQLFCAEVSNAESNSFLRNLLDISGINSRIAPCLKKSAVYQALRRIHSLDTIPLEKKAQTVLLWGDIGTLKAKYPCYKYPFLFPALTGMAVKDGFVYENCHGVNYSFEYYKQGEATLNPLPDTTKLIELVIDIDGGSVKLSSKDG